MGPANIQNPAKKDFRTLRKEKEVKITLPVFVKIESCTNHSSSAALVAESADASIGLFRLKLYPRNPRVVKCLIRRLGLAQKHDRNPKSDVRGFNRIATSKHKRFAERPLGRNTTTARLLHNFPLKGLEPRLAKKHSSARAINNLYARNWLQLGTLPLPLLVGADIHFNPHFVINELSCKSKNTNCEQCFVCHNTPPIKKLSNSNILF